MLATYTLWLRDILRFHRQRGRLAGALGTPLVFWALLGSGFGRSFSGGAQPGGGYLEYFFPGTLALIVLFTAIFSAMSVIDDRQEGFLQGVLASPAPRASIVLGKVLGGATIATGQASLVLALAPFAGIPLTWARVPLAVLVIVLIAVGVTALGFVIAWRFDTTQGFHAVVNLLLMPLWILSGAVFPAAGAAAWLRVLMAVNPLSYGVSALQWAVLGHSAGPALGVSLAVAAGFAASLLAAGVATVARRA
jgi:ABC-2 type transport system permease protein